MKPRTVYLTCICANAVRHAKELRRAGRNVYVRKSRYDQWSVFEKATPNG